MSNDRLSDTFADRLRAVLDEQASLSAFSRRCGVGDNLLRKYLSGSEPGLDKIVRIAQAAEVKLEWLATGRGAMRESLAQPIADPIAPQLATDHRLVGRLTEKIAALYKEMGFFDCSASGGGTRCH